MKTLIVLAGLVTVEKVDLSVEIAEHFSATGESVAILDNISRLSISSELVFRERLIHHPHDILPDLASTLGGIDEEIVVFAVSETVSPDALFIALDDLEGWDIVSLALIDLRTCDCFPHIRSLLETYADIVVDMPYDKSNVLKAIDATHSHISEH